VERCGIDLNSGSLIVGIEGAIEDDEEVIRGYPSPVTFPGMQVTIPLSESPLL
jgi:hypothetical protein